MFIQKSTKQTMGIKGIKGQIINKRSPKTNSSEITIIPASKIKNRTIAPIMREIERPIKFEKRSLIDRPPVLVSIWRKGAKKV